MANYRRDVARGVGQNVMSTVMAFHCFLFLSLFLDRNNLSKVEERDAVVGKAFFTLQNPSFL